jgi:hypothetical protein
VWRNVVAYVLNDVRTEDGFVWMRAQTACQQHLEHEPYMLNVFGRHATEDQHIINVCHAAVPKVGTGKLGIHNTLKFGRGIDKPERHARIRPQLVIPPVRGNVLAVVSKGDLQETSTQVKLGENGSGTLTLEQVLGQMQPIEITLSGLIDFSDFPCKSCGQSNYHRHPSWQA